jgi:Tetratricopeptide repeat/Surface lipoprotein assembly modifier
MALADDIDLSGHRALGRWLRVMAFAGLMLARTGQAAEPDLAKAEQLLKEGQAAEAAALFEQALEADPSSVGAHLGLGRALYAQGEYARARIEFESVLKFGNLPPDMQSQTEVYDQVAADYAAGKRWQPFYYAETGVGNYRENSSSSTDIFGGAGNNDTFLPIRVGGGWSTRVSERHTFNGTLDYRFRWYDDSDRRNDSDLRWNFNLSRPVDDDNLRFGVRGRASYRGDSQYRNDWGVFADYRLGFGDSDQLTIGGEVRERRYPQGPERDRTRDIAQLTASWTHSLPNGRTSFTLGGQLTQEWATQERPDGNASFWGVNGEVDHSFSDALDGVFWWSYDSESYDEERPDFTTDPDLLLTRNDDLWHFGASLVWGFARGWSLRPTIEYNWEDSNVDALAYSSTEYWLTVRKSF